MTIHDEYRAKHPKSAALWERARRAIPGGITHDIRHLAPFPIYVERAAGTRKWDVDGNEYVDYWMGHGALFLGHCHPAVVRAVQEQVARGTHLGACHELEVRWAELVNAARSRAPSWCASPCRAPRRRTSPCAWRAPTPAARRS